MAEFAHYNHEDSDDDAPAEHSQHAEHTPPVVEPEHPPVPAQQEGTIFSRDKIASDLSRPLFDFIRKQEQPGAHIQEHAEPMAAPEALPSVSNPSEPETRTYLPPADAEVAQAIHDAAAEEDDDDDEASADDSAAQHAAPGAVPAPKPRQPEPAAEQRPQPVVHRQEIERPLNEQFEEIMRAEMGEDYNRMASGEHLGETEDGPAPDDPRTFVANWPHQQSEYAEPEQPAGDGEPDAFYYAEPEPQEPRPFSEDEAAAIARAARFDQFHAEARDANTPRAHGAPHRAASGGAGGGGVTPPPTGGTHGAASGGMPFGGGAPVRANFNVAPVVQAATTVTSPLEMFRSPNQREKAHKGRYFAAGFITGWAVKQHLANKKMQRMNQEHQRATEAQQEKIDTLGYNQYHMGQRLNRTETKLRETETAATQQAARTAEAQSTARQQQERAERAISEAPVAAAAAVETARVAERVAEASAPAQTAEAAIQHQSAEQPVRPMAEQPQPAPNRMESTPLQYAAAAAETPFAAASAASVAGRAERAPVPFAAEAQKAVPVAERPPKTPAEEAADLVEQAYKLQSGEHIEHATGGGHNIVVDAHGHEVQGAITYGEEFKFQQRQEQMRAGVFGNADDTAKRQANAQQGYDTGIITGLGGQAGGYPAMGSSPQLGSATTDKRLPLGIPKSVNPQHLLRARNQNPMVATIASPWLWASVIVLIVAFFVAALI